MAKAPTYDPPDQRHQFVFVKSCGCPLGVVEGSYAKTEDGAWDMVAESRKEEREMRAAGVRVVHVSHAEYVQRYYAPMMAERCEH